MTIALSKLRKTWIFDLDGTLVSHNGYKRDGDKVLPGVKDLFQKIKDDFIVIITARDLSTREETVRFLQENELRYDQIVFGAPVGERILLNDEKPGGLVTAHAVSLKRDQGLEDFRFEIVESI